jgi:hypothetical protein
MDTSPSDDATVTGEEEPVTNGESPPGEGVALSNEQPPSGESPEEKALRIARPVPPADNLNFPPKLPGETTAALNQANDGWLKALATKGKGRRSSTGSVSSLKKARKAEVKTPLKQKNNE